MNWNSRLWLRILLIISWLLLFAVGIEAGSFITNAVLALVNPGAVKYAWQEVDLSDLLKYDTGYFFVMTLIMSIVAVMRVWLFYLIVILLHQKIDMQKPFTNAMRRFMFTASYITLIIGLFSIGGSNYREWIMKKGVVIPDVEDLRLGGADVWLIMSVTVFIIGHLIKRGLEIQTENELTV